MQVVSVSLYEPDASCQGSAGSTLDCRLGCLSVWFCKSVTVSSAPSVGEERAPWAQVGEKRGSVSVRCPCPRIRYDISSGRWETAEREQARTTFGTFWRALEIKMDGNFASLALGRDQAKSSAYRLTATATGTGTATGTAGQGRGPTATATAPASVRNAGTRKLSRTSTTVKPRTGEGLTVGLQTPKQSGRGWVVAQQSATRMQWMHSPSGHVSSCVFCTARQIAFMATHAGATAEPCPLLGTGSALEGNLSEEPDSGVCSTRPLGDKDMQQLYLTTYIVPSSSTYLGRDGVPVRQGISLTNSNNNDRRAIVQADAIVPSPRLAE